VSPGAVPVVKFPSGITMLLFGKLMGVGGFSWDQPSSACCRVRVRLGNPLSVCYTVYVYVSHHCLPWRPSQSGYPRLCCGNTEGLGIQKRQGPPPENISSPCTPSCLSGIQTHEKRNRRDGRIQDIEPDERMWSESGLF